LSIRGDCPAPLFKQITLTLNPWSDATWIKARFFDKPGEDAFTDTTNYLGNEFLGEDDKKVFEAMRASAPRRRQIEGLGEWGRATHCQQVKGWIPSQSRGKPETGGCHGKNVF
jgi:phage terminase large subunit